MESQSPSTVETRGDALADAVEKAMHRRRNSNVATNFYALIMELGAALDAYNGDR